MKKHIDFPDPVPVVTTNFRVLVRLGHGLLLMAMQSHRAAINAKDLCRVRMENCLLHQVRNRCSPFRSSD